LQPGNGNVTGQFDEIGRILGGVLGHDDPHEGEDCER
jgi:hypothetical protein